MNRGRQKKALRAEWYEWGDHDQVLPGGGTRCLDHCVRAADNEMVVWDGLPRQNRVLKVATLRPQMKDRFTK